MEWMKKQDNGLENLVYGLKKRGYSEVVLIGRGAFSEVYRMREERSGRFVACKVSEASGMAEREAVLLRELEHPLFPEFLEAWQEGGKYYLVMEYISGRSLQKLVEHRGALSGKQVVHIGKELAEGLGFLHERAEPILFRDLKPENVMIREDGRVKLVDLGCACEGAIAERSIAGSRGYAPPEQFSLEEQPGRESDVYALGRLLQFLLHGRNGRRRFQQKQGMALAEWRCRRKLDRILQQAVWEERQKRIPDMYSFQQMLETCNGENGCFWSRMGRKTSAKKIVSEMDFYYVNNVRQGF